MQVKKKLVLEDYKHEKDEKSDADVDAWEDS